VSGDRAQQDPLTEGIIACAMQVHSRLGPGLLESAYETCLAYELMKQAYAVERQVPVPICYDGMRLDAGYQMDLVVGTQIILEVKAIEKLLAIHTAQLLTYLRLSGLKTGLLLNFNVLQLKDGIKRVSN
jgi:GxxExxY protein